MNLSLEPKRTALLVMDLQTEVIAMAGEKATAVVTRTATVIAAARKAGMLVVYVVVGFRPGYPELNANNARFAAIKESGRFVVTTPSANIPAEVRPTDADPIVVKHRVSAFASTDLEMILRAKAIDTLLLTGIATSGVVLSTTRHAADADYQIVVVADCCCDADDEVHGVLIEKVLARQATVVSAAEAIAAIDPA